MTQWLAYLTMRLYFSFLAYWHPPKEEPQEENIDHVFSLNDEQIEVENSFDNRTIPPTRPNTPSDEDGWEEISG